MINGKDQEIITINKTGNSILNNAKYSADNTDEWYTTYETIAEELSHYKNQFIDKVVLCNCDDPFESNFCYYFLRHFNQLKLKKLICTSYSGSKIDQLVNGQLTLDLLDADGNPVINNKHGYVLTITQIPGEHEEEVPDNVIKNVLQKKNVVRKLSGNGDFRSQECIEYLKECDICCTNPPFSLFSELFSLLVKYDKKYLLIGNQNAITYKEIFPYIKENKAWVGYRFGDMAFRVPQDTMPRKTRYWVDEYGQKWRSLGNAMWLTNLDTERRHQELTLTQCYDPVRYPKGFADVTGYIRKSNYAYHEPQYRVYFEIPHNWELVADFSNLLKSIDIPVQNIDWAHPNMRDGDLKKYNQGKPDFWKKEHQVKVWAVEYQPIGFAVLHKQEALDYFAEKHRLYIEVEQHKKVHDVTHRYYWEMTSRKRKKPSHPGENDPFIPEEIRGNHYDSWKEIANDLGYNKES